MMWNPAEATHAENARWCHLRAIEWSNWPCFVSQPIAPVALLFFPWKTVLLSMIAAGALWALAIGDRIVMPKLASAAVWFVRLKWLACPLTAYLLWDESHGIALLALLWPLATLPLMALTMLPMALIPLPKPRIGVIEAKFALSLGYEEQV
jgi:hypothetical protein